MLYLEAPIGVGFSYSTDTSSYEAVNDKITGMFTCFKPLSLVIEKKKGKLSKRLKCLLS